MVANGHHWSSIKTYTLSEIGSFFKTVVILERDKKAQTISDIWQGNNLTIEGLKQVLSSLGTKLDSKPPETPVDEVNKDWKRLASFMAKQQG